MSMWNLKIQQFNMFKGKYSSNKSSKIETI